MPKAQLKLNTIEDLAKEAVKPFSGERYSMHSRTGWKWLNPEEGEAWEKDYPDRWEIQDWKTWSNEQKIAYDRARDSAKPKMIPDDHYFLDYHTSRTTKYEISEELFYALDNIWTKQPLYTGSDRLERKGKLTLQGIVKRLGRVDLLLAAKQAQFDALKARRIENQKARIKQALEQVSEAIWNANDLDLSKVPYDFNALAEFVGMEVK